MIADPVALPILQALVACLEQEVQHLAVPPKVTCLRPGDRIELLIAQNRDECCEGLAWVRLAGIYPSTNFPTQDEDYQRCQTGWGVVVEMGIGRCAPVGDENRLPSCDEWTASAEAVAGDAAALRRTLLCFKTLEDFRYTMYVPGLWTPMTTEGGCVGGAMSVTVHAPACDELINLPEDS